MKKEKISEIVKFIFTKNNASDFAFIAAGSLVQATAMVFFLIPASLISGGLSGLSQVINHYTNLPIGTMTLIGNIPLFVIGWRFLSGPRFAVRTIFAVLTFSIFTDILYFLTPDTVITRDIILNTLFGAVILGIGLGFVYKGSGTSGGSDIICRILNFRLGIPITQSYLIADVVVIIAAAFAFGWDLAFYGLIAIYVSGIAAETIAEGGSVYRDIMIVTKNADAVASAVFAELERTVTFLDATGAYSNQQTRVVYCVIYRNEVIRLKKIVYEIDPKAFMVVGHAAEVLGEGFRNLKPQS